MNNLTSNQKQFLFPAGLINVDKILNLDKNEDVVKFHENIFSFKNRNNENGLVKKLPFDPFIQKRSKFSIVLEKVL